jgi:hypothetical protein
MVYMVTKLVLFLVGMFVLEIVLVPCLGGMCSLALELSKETLLVQVLVGKVYLELVLVLSQGQRSVQGIALELSQEDMCNLVQELDMVTV